MSAGSRTVAPVLWLALFLFYSTIPAAICQSSTAEASQAPAVVIAFPENGAVIREQRWSMKLRFSHFQGLSALVMFGTGVSVFLSACLSVHVPATGQSLNLSPLDSSFDIVITDFENGPYDVSVILLDSNRNPVGASGEASITFIVNVSLPQHDTDLEPFSASPLPRRLNAAQQPRSLALNVLRIALSYSRSIDAKM
jgi:hypothetical protein